MPRILERAVCASSPSGAQDPLSREATVRTPFHALITTGQRQEK